MQDIFISHSSKDSVVANAVCHHLEEVGIRCFMAPRDIMAGELWAEAIVSGIKKCRIFVLIFSTNSNQSKQVSKEISIAVESGLVVIPFKISDDKPAGVLQYYMVDTHWIDALTPPVEIHIQHLAARITSILGSGGCGDEGKPEEASLIDPEEPHREADNQNPCVNRFCRKCGFGDRDAVLCPICHGKMMRRDERFRILNVIPLISAIVWLLVALYSGFILGYMLFHANEVEITAAVLTVLSVSGISMAAFILLVVWFGKRWLDIRDHSESGQNLAAASLTQHLHEWLRIPMVVGIAFLFVHAVILLLINFLP